MSLQAITELQESRMSFEEARVRLFNLENYKALLQYRLPRALVRLFEWAMEFEDAAEIAPGAIADSYKAAAALAHRVLARPRAKARRVRDVIIKATVAPNARPVGPLWDKTCAATLGIQRPAAHNGLPTGALWNKKGCAVAIKHRAAHNTRRRGDRAVRSRG
jgi:hypothetical protein